MVWFGVVLFKHKEYIPTYVYFWNEHVTCNEVVWSVYDVTLGGV